MFARELISLMSSCLFFRWIFRYISLFKFFVWWIAALNPRRFEFPPQGWMTSHCRCTSLTRRKFTAIWPHQYLGVIQSDQWLTNTHFQTKSLISLKMVMIHSTKKIDNDLAGRKLEVAYGQWNKKHACTRRCVHYNTRHFLSKINLKKRKNSIIQQMLKNNFGKYFSGS